MELGPKEFVISQKELHTKLKILGYPGHFTRHPAHVLERACSLILKKRVMWTGKLVGKNEDIVLATWEDPPVYTRWDRFKQFIFGV